MKKFMYVFAGICFFISCTEKKSASTTATNTVSDAQSYVTTKDAGATAEKKPRPEFLKSIRYSDWEIGDPENIKPVLGFYEAWDKKDLQKLSGLFADTVRLRIPDEKEEIVIPNNKINEALGQNRKMYDSSSNSIISAVSLHDLQSNENWVMITTYSKWIEKNGKRDSVLYNDDWRIKDGKISFLMSFDKKPTGAFLKRNDSKNRINMP